MDWLVGIAGVMVPILGVSLLLIVCFKGLGQDALRADTPERRVAPAGPPGDGSTEDRSTAPRT